MQSWIDLNPGWDYRFWTDDDLLAFMRVEFPHLLDIYLAYPNPVQRADLSRYCLLWHFGGVYADIDTACIAPLEPLAGETRVVLCSEPTEHFSLYHARGLDKIWFNGTMASPARHPFWLSLIELCKVMAQHSHVDVLATTGPLVLSAAVEQWPDQSQLSLNSCHIFTPHARGGILDETPSSGPHGHLRLSEHYWQGSWFDQHLKTEWSQRFHALRRGLKGRLRKLKYRLTAGRQLTLSSASESIDLAMLALPVPPRDPVPRVVIFLPVRNGEKYLETNLALLKRLDYPKDRLRIVYGEGESNDGSAETIDRLIREHASEFAGMERLRIQTGGRSIKRKRRWYPAIQLERRSMIAKARNAIVSQGLRADDDWVLWIDIDVIDFPPERTAETAGKQTGRSSFRIAFWMQADPLMTGIHSSMSRSQLPRIITSTFITACSSLMRITAFAGNLMDCAISKRCRWTVSAGQCCWLQPTSTAPDWCFRKHAIAT